MTIIFVCTGNTCRSPMAEALARDALRRRDLRAVVCSAGLAADGQPIAENAETALSELGLTMSRHRSRPLTAEMAEAADLLLTMTDDHRRMLLAAGIPSEKVRVLGGGIPDPFGGDMEVYRRTRDTLRDAVEALLCELQAEGAL